MLVQDHGDEIDNHIAQKIMDHNLFKQVKDLHDQLKPIADALNKAQSDSTSIAEGCHLFLDLMSLPVLQCHKSKVAKRFKDAIQPCHLAAYMTDARYFGTPLEPDLREKAVEFLQQKNDESWLHYGP